MRKSLALSVVLLFILGSCSTERSGNFELYLTDAPIEGLEHVFVTFSQIELREEGSDVFTSLLEEPKEYDLLTLRDREERVIRTDLPQGTYTAIRITISAARIVIDGRTWTITIDPPKIVTVPVEFTVLEDGVIKCVLDFDAAQSINPAGLGYDLAPVITVKRIGY
jgi:hypothetical protein